MASAPVRTCVGCGAKAPAVELLRLVVGPDGLVRVDIGGRAGGRGAHVHPAESCLRAAAAQRVLGRAFRGKGRTPGEAELVRQAAQTGPKAPGLEKGTLTVKSASD